MKELEFTDLFIHLSKFSRDRLGKPFFFYATAIDALGKEHVSESWQVMNLQDFPKLVSKSILGRMSKA